MITILTTNNSTLMQQLGSPAFQRVGVNHLVAQSGQEAMEITRSEKPAVAILDVELPDESGYAVCRKLKDDPEHGSTRVVLIVEGAVTADVITSLSDSRWCPHACSGPGDRNAQCRRGDGERRDRCALMARRSSQDPRSR